MLDELIQYFARTSPHVYYSGRVNKRRDGKWKVEWIEKTNEERKQMELKKKKKGEKLN